MFRWSSLVLGCLFGASMLSAQPFTPAAGAELLHRPLDQILDVNVRDGLVYWGCAAYGPER